jgi:hypothetical protein
MGIAIVVCSIIERIIQEQNTWKNYVRSILFWYIKGFESDCMSTYEIEEKKLKNLLRNVNKVNITTDKWSSGQRVS